LRKIIAVDEVAKFLPSGYSEISKVESRWDGLTKVMRPVI
jgi:hypothetical protein